jgi:acyl carrier protein
MNSFDETLKRVLDLVRDYAAPEKPDAEVCDPDVELTALGVQSLGVAALIADLEGRFDIRFPSEMLETRVFRCSRSIARAVDFLRSSAGPR